MEGFGLGNRDKEYHRGQRNVPACAKSMYDIIGGGRGIGVAAAGWACRCMNGDAGRWEGGGSCGRGWERGAGGGGGGGGANDGGSFAGVASGIKEGGTVVSSSLGGGGGGDGGGGGGVIDMRGDGLV